MDSLFIKISATILVVFIVELFLSGYAVVFYSLDSFASVIKHFHFSFDHYIEIAFFHLFSIGMILFIVLHLLSIFRVKNSLGFETTVNYFLLFVSHIAWYLLSSPTLKIVASLSLFFYLFYLLILLLKRLYQQTIFH